MFVVLSQGERMASMLRALGQAHGSRSVSVVRTKYVLVLIGYLYAAGSGDRHSQAHAPRIGRHTVQKLQGG